MKRIQMRWSTCRALLAGWCLALALLGCRDAETDTDDVQMQGQRTVLVYMAAENSMQEGYGADGLGQHHKDSAEMVRGSKSLLKHNRLLMFVDDKSAPRLYLLTAADKAPRLVRTWTDDVCSTSPDVLRDVLNWVAEHYPSREYGLVMWSHGTGWLPSTNKDYGSTIAEARRSEATPSGKKNETSAVSLHAWGIDVGTDGVGDKTADGSWGAQMDVADMAQAIAQSRMGHLKYIFFDACLMQSVETCYALREVTDYVVASPISTPMAGADYEGAVRKGLFSADPADIARTYFAAATDPDRQREEYDDFGMVISVVRTDRLPALAEAVKTALPLTPLCKRESPDMNGVLNYAHYAYKYDYRPHNYDAACVLRHLLPAGSSELEACLATLNEAVVCRLATDEFWIGSWSGNQSVDAEAFCGLAMFVPQQVYASNAKYCSHGNLNEAFATTAWYGAAGWASTGW